VPDDLVGSGLLEPKVVRVLKLVGPLQEPLVLLVVDQLVVAAGLVVIVVVVVVTAAAFIVIVVVIVVVLIIILLQPLALGQVALQEALVGVELVIVRAKVVGEELLSSYLFCGLGGVGSRGLF
jgi:E3 ubiquitin-protein ligase DOA10